MALEAPAPTFAASDVTGLSSTRREHSRTHSRSRSIVARLRSRIHSRETARGSQQPGELLSPRSRPETHAVSAIGDLPPRLSIDASRTSQEEEAIVTGHQIWSLSSGLHRPASTHVGSALAGSAFVASQRVSPDRSMWWHQSFDVCAPRTPGCCFNVEIEGAAGGQLPIHVGGDPVRGLQFSKDRGCAASRTASFPLRLRAPGDAARRFTCSSHGALSSLVDPPSNMRPLMSEGQGYQGAPVPAAPTLSCGTPCMTPLSSLRGSSTASSPYGSLLPHSASAGLAATELACHACSTAAESPRHALPLLHSVGRELEESFDEAQQAPHCLPFEEPPFESS